MTSNLLKKDIVQPEGISNALTEKCLENVELKKYVDVDKQLQEQLRKDTEYYHNVLKRVIAVVKYLAIIGLAFRGTEEVFGSPHNADLLTSTSPIAAISESEPVNLIPNNVPYTSDISAFPSNSSVQPTSASTSIQDTKQKAKTRARKRKKELLKKINDAIIEIKMTPHKPRKSTPEQDSEDEDIIDYNPDEFDPDECVQKYYNIGEYKSAI
ncbi:hypothetical protein TNCV_583851 [Trichonephila clavipes]|nr:hypothetical protein TNCV_583851 [Trichonephila clavipes]